MRVKSLLIGILFILSITLPMSAKVVKLDCNAIYGPTSIHTQGAMKFAELVKKYSNYVGTPIMMKEYDSRTEEEKIKEPKEMNFEQVNETKPIWKKNKSEIKTEEYKTFYQSVSSDWNEPLFTLHNNVE